LIEGLVEAEVVAGVSMRVIEVAARNMEEDGISRE